MPDLIATHDLHARLSILEQAPVGRADDQTRAQIYRLLADLARAAGDYPDAVRVLAYSLREAQDSEQIYEIELVPADGYRVDSLNYVGEVFGRDRARIRVRPNRRTFARFYLSRL